MKPDEGWIHESSLGDETLIIDRGSCHLHAYCDLRIGRLPSPH